MIIHCATSTKGDAEATSNLVTAAAKAGSPHFVQPSIVGIDAMAAWGYVKAKLEVERIVKNSGLSLTRQILLRTGKPNLRGPKTPRGGLPSPGP